jgi:CO/xanthine dehydrogenase FAD-binding subunit
MEFLSPTSLADALAARAEHPDAVAIMGGTDVMVELNFDRHRPGVLLDLTRIPELATWERADGEIRLGAGVTYTRVIDELGGVLPGLALASRTVGSPQIRNRGTVGGNLGAASPAGDTHPALLAALAEVELSSTSGVRRVPVHEFYAGVKRHVGRPEELITAVWVRAASGPQQFSKIGTRNAMVIAVAAFGLALHPEHQRVATGIGSAAPTPRRASAAEAFVSAELDWATRGDLSRGLADEFGRLVATAASPIDDVRGTAAYRLHALSVMARRCLGWAWTAHQRGDDG